MAAPAARIQAQTPEHPMALRDIDRSVVLTACVLAWLVACMADAGAIPG